MLNEATSVTTTAEGSSNSLPYFEKLRGENYNDWSFAMSMFLKHGDLWHSIVGYPEDDTAWVGTRKDQKELTKICLMVQLNRYSHVRGNFHKMKDYVNEFMDASQKLNSIGKLVVINFLASCFKADGNGY
ncbi:hypothetical protein JTB14_021871 [Gonioctena quinquepunctata]|nr:hypothetical protein JTB14_021871 [Gonioctena quinquepunctata]